MTDYTQQDYRRVDDRMDQVIREMAQISGDLRAFSADMRTVQRDVNDLKAVLNDRQTKALSWNIIAMGLIMALFAGAIVYFAARM